MRNVLITIILVVGASYLSFKGAYWLGAEKTRVELEAQYVSLQNTPIVNRSEYYNQYLLKQCLLDNIVLKEKLRWEN